MQFIADLHTHTLCASHAFNTLTEMTAAAREMGLAALALTDHAPAMPDAPPPIIKISVFNSMSEPPVVILFSCTFSDMLPPLKSQILK